ncbi:ArnT family glycosyltransferase [Kitasatospora sp. NBC_00315]|uniref:ArnT family glycosyltransferase n=1 Tax=Kitasatospora sp. NBC_00315 TaxID=2975963 RepID=UPI00324F8543
MSANTRADVPGTAASSPPGPGPTGATPAGARSRPRGPALRTAALASAAFVVATLLRLVGLGRAQDIFGDEVYYRAIGNSVASGGFPYFPGDGGELFFLHPPGYFYLEAGWQRLFGYRPDIVAGIYQMRSLNAVLAGATAAVLVVLVARLRSRYAAAAIAALFALDPFVLRVNDRVLLETATMFWVLLGYLVLIGLTRRPLPARPGARALAGGLLLGLAVLTKDEAALMTTVPVLVAMVLGWGPPRRLLAWAAAASLLPYTVYVVVVAANGHLVDLVNTKTVGVQRLLGLVQETGFNAPRAPSLWSRLGHQASTFGVTYLLLAVGAVALYRLLRRGDQARRLLALLHASAAVTLVYALLFGTLEEQALYLLLVPTMISVVLAAPVVRRPVTRAAVAALVALTLALGLSGAAYATGRITPDDGYSELRAYMAAHVPARAAVATVGGDSDLILTDRYRVGAWVTPAQRAAAQARYAVVFPQAVEHGYSTATPDQARALMREGRLLYVFHGRSYGTIALYELPLPGSAGG